MSRSPSAAAATFLLLMSQPALAGEWGPWREAVPAAVDPYRPAALNEAVTEESNPARLTGLLLIRAYQGAGGAGMTTGTRCQFSPSCSRFTFSAIAAYGLLNGSIMGAERISRCHGFAGLGGYAEDPVLDRLLDPVAAHRPPFAFLSPLGL